MKPFAPPQYSKRLLLLLLLVSLFCFIPIGVFVPMWALSEYALVTQRAPVVRFTGGGIVTVFFLPLGIVSAIICVLQLLNQPERFERFRSSIGEKAFIAILVFGGLGFLIAPIAARIVLPQYGYSICHKLEGGMNLYHNDWVQNPEWCVRGKSHEWVNAMAARAAGADIDPDTLSQKPRNTQPLSNAAVLWMLAGLLLGAGFWFNQLRHDRQHGTVRRWLVALASGAGVGFLSAVMTLAAYELSGHLTGQPFWCWRQC